MRRCYRGTLLKCRFGLVVLGRGQIFCIPSSVYKRWQRCQSAHHCLSLPLIWGCLRQLYCNEPNWDLTLTYMLALQSVVFWFIYNQFRFFALLISKWLKIRYLITFLVKAQHDTWSFMNKYFILKSWIL